MTTKNLSHLEQGLNRKTLRLAKAARRSLIFCIPAFVALLIVRGVIPELSGGYVRTGLEIANAICVGVLGIFTAQAIGKAMLPPLAARFGSDTAGQVDFLIRIVALCVVILVSLSVAGVSLSGVFASAGVLTLLIGFACQQTLQQIIAGVVLLTTRRVKVGDRVQIHYPAIEGKVTRIGLMYSLFERRPSQVWNVPNATLLQATVTTVRTASPISIKATVKDPQQLEDLRERLAQVKIPTQDAPDVEIASAEQGELQLVLSATPQANADRQRLERELAALIA